MRLRLGAAPVNGWWPAVSVFLCPWACMRLLLLMLCVRACVCRVCVPVGVEGMGG